MRLRERFPAIVGPRTDDICYATTNRQLAVKQLAKECDLVLVIGSRNSSNSNRLVEVAREYGAASHLIDNESEVREEWLDGMRVVGITSGASAPEDLVKSLVQFFRDRGTDDVQELEVVQEDVRFMLPKTIRQALAGQRLSTVHTLVISDLHIGAGHGRAALEDPALVRHARRRDLSKPAPGAARRHQSNFARGHSRTRSPLLRASCQSWSRVSAPVAR